MLSKMKTRVKGEKEMKMKKLMVLLLSCSVVFAGSFTNAYAAEVVEEENTQVCLLYTSPSPRDGLLSRMPSSA